VERKLATVLFVDLVDSTRLLATTDPEVVRRRVNRYFDQVAHCVESHGGVVEKFAGDAVMAAFGVPRAHEDDGERAVRAALAIRDAVADLGLEVRMGIESGEVVTEESDSTFATGEPVNVAARLQQAAAAGEILLGPGVHGLAQWLIDSEEVEPVEVRGLGRAVPAWRLLGADAEVGRALRVSAPFVGREADLELLHNAFERAKRDNRGQLVTIYGYPGVGKSRLAREFVAGLEGTTILAGRCLPYGEGITYWPLAEMVKAAAGISDDDPTAEALEKLRECCGDDAVADLLGLASGVLDAVTGDRSAQEIAWAAHSWATELADAQPLVLVFEDIHWAEEPLLDLVEHLAERVRDVPVLLLCLARPELFDVREDWGGGRLRAVAIELEPLPPEDSEQLVDALLDDTLDPRRRAAVLAKTEGNPLFLEETVRMLVERGSDDGDGLIPDTVQALIAARIDRLPARDRALLRRAAVIGRVFWAGAAAALTPGDGVDEALDELIAREFVTQEPRSTISGERAFRFKHVLIREVAYAGLAKGQRAELHERFADWLSTRGADELVEIRAFHLGRAASLHAELDGAPPAELASQAAEALQLAGKRALSRDALASARKLLLQALELEPTLDRRYLAAKAALRMGDLPAVSVEMEQTLREAEAADDRRLKGRALTGLAHAILYRDADLPRARELGERGFEAVAGDDDIGSYEALDLLSTIAWWEGDLAAAEWHAQQKLSIAERLERVDLQSSAFAELAAIHNVRLDDEPVEPLIDRALELAELSGSLLARAWALRQRAEQRANREELDAAELDLKAAHALFEEAGTAVHTAKTLNWLAHVACLKGEPERAERYLREAIRILKPLGDRGTLVETQRQLAEVLLELDRLDEAERYALQARETVGPEDASSRATTRGALGLVRAAQGRDQEAERLLREAVAILEATDFRRWEQRQRRLLAQFLRERGRDDEAETVLASAPAAKSAARIA
jgi:class 3 adenylate cyclase/tetratricopeptide (TPR) repeat protein